MIIGKIEGVNFKEGTGEQVILGKDGSLQLMERNTLLLMQT